MKSDQMGTGHNNPSPRELPLSNQARFSLVSVHKPPFSRLILEFGASFLTASWVLLRAFARSEAQEWLYEGLAGGQSGIGKTWRLPVCRFVDPPERRQADRRRTKTTRL